MTLMVTVNALFAVRCTFDLTHLNAQAHQWFTDNYSSAPCWTLWIEQQTHTDPQDRLSIWTSRSAKINDVSLGVFESRELQISPSRQMDHLVLQRY